MDQQVDEDWQIADLLKKQASELNNTVSQMRKRRMTAEIRLSKHSGLELAIEQFDYDGVEHIEILALKKEISL